MQTRSCVATRVDKSDAATFIKRRHPIQLIKTNSKIHRQSQHYNLLAEFPPFKWSQIGFKTYLIVVVARLGTRTIEKRTEGKSQGGVHFLQTPVPLSSYVWHIISWQFNIWKLEEKKMYSSQRTMKHPDTLVAITTSTTVAYVLQPKYSIWVVDPIMWTMTKWSTTKLTKAVVALVNIRHSFGFLTTHQRRNDEHWPRSRQCIAVGIQAAATGYFGTLKARLKTVSSTISLPSIVQFRIS